jgi:hypothetical protein
MRNPERVKPVREEVRSVGTCAYCGTAVLLRVKVYRVGRSREASCSCGATVISPTFFARARLAAKGLGE